MLSLWARDARMVFAGATFCGQGWEGGMAKGNGFVRRVDCPAPRLSAASRARGGAAQPGRPARVPAAGALPTAAPAPAAGTRPARVPPSRASPLSPSSPALAGCAAALRAGKLAISGHQTAFWHAERAPSPEEGAPPRRKPRSAVSAKPMRRRIGAGPCQNSVWRPEIASART